MQSLGWQPGLDGFSLTCRWQSWKETDVPGGTMPICPIDPTNSVLPGHSQADTQGSEGYVLISLLPQCNLRDSQVCFRKYCGD